MYILGISAFYHDSAACLVKDGEILSAAQEERYSRKKHDQDFPKNAINYCLSHSGINSSQIDLIAFYDKPFLKFERLLETYLTFAPMGIKSFIKSMPVWIKEKLWMKDFISKELNYNGKIIFPEHHESHAASAFYPSPFNEAAILTMDGVGEWTTTSYGVGNGNDLNLIADIKFPHSLGLLYSAFTYYTGFKVNSGEYKVMGLAPYGEPIYKNKILDNLIEVKDDGSFKMNMDYYDYCVGLTMTNEKFNKLFGGKPRKPESKITQREMDLARSLQEVTEEIVLKMGNHLFEETGMKNLTLAGGVALNCVANGRLLKEGKFENIWIQPASGDAGGAIGAALIAWYKYYNNPRIVDEINDSQKGSYLGSSFNENEISTYLKEKQIPYKVLNEEELLNKVVDLINEEKVIGWFQGRMEFGPRALGARSILGDPRSPKMQSKMNLKIKYRESFRPFAPAILFEKVSDYFDFDSKSPYMLLVSNIKENHKRKITDDENKLFGIDKLNVMRSDIPAVTHVDYSARIQTVHQETNPRFYKLLKIFNEKYDCPVLINTSFNVRGEPIVCTPEDAFNCFMRTEMDYLVIENILISKEDQKTSANNLAIKNNFDLD